MNEQLHKMAADTMAVLRERNALPDVANSAEVRYAADYIVKKSPFAPYFAALGITKGSQIGRTFDQIRGVAFFRTVVHLYYANWYYQDTNPAVQRILDGFKTEPWEVVASSARNYFVDFVREIRTRVNCSVGIGVEADYHHEQVTRDMNTLLRHTGNGAEFLAAAKNIGAHADSVALSAYITERQNEPEIQAWLEEHIDEVVEAFMRYGRSRSMLTYCHGFKIKPIKLHKYAIPVGEDTCNMQGYTHATLNAMATAYQDDYLHRIAQVDNCELCEETQKEEEYIEQPITNEEMSDNIFTSGSLTSAAVPAKVTALANRLAAKHGPVTITNEASGLHIYIPDPELLTQDGRKELASKHLAINAELYLGIGRYDEIEHPTKENKKRYEKYRRHGKEVPCAVSMKTKKLYSVETLLMMRPIEQRVANLGNIRRSVVTTDINKHLVYDENGNLVPEWCGKTVPLTELPTDHPAIIYLEQRNFNPKELCDVWDIVYCTEALPEDSSRERFYGRLPMGRRNSPTGRIILPIYDSMGVRRGWQARVIDHKDDAGNKWVWTDQENWLQVESEGKDMFTSDIWPKGFAVHKYMNAKGSQRNTLLFGIKQAIKFNEGRPFNQRYCVLVEGPLDAIRGGAPCIALLGKTISQDQAAEIRKNFAVICTVMDQDKAGQECLKKIYQQLSGMPIHELTVPEGNKDLGDCSPEDAKALISAYDPVFL